MFFWSFKFDNWRWTKLVVTPGSCPSPRACWTWTALGWTTYCKSSTPISPKTLSVFLTLKFCLSTRPTTACSTGVASSSNIEVRSSRTSTGSFRSYLRSESVNVVDFWLFLLGQLRGGEVRWGGFRLGEVRLQHVKVR